MSHAKTNECAASSHTSIIQKKCSVKVNYVVNRNTVHILYTVSVASDTTIYGREMKAVLIAHAQIGAFVNIAIPHRIRSSGVRRRHLLNTPFLSAVEPT